MSLSMLMLVLYVDVFSLDIDCGNTLTINNYGFKELEINVDINLI